MEKGGGHQRPHRERKRKKLWRVHSAAAPWREKEAGVEEWKKKKKERNLQLLIMVRSLGLPVTGGNNGGLAGPWNTEHRTLQQLTLIDFDALDPNRNRTKHSGKLTTYLPRNILN